jgi:hypothetical protein
VKEGKKGWKWEKWEYNVCKIRGMRGDRAREREEQCGVTKEGKERERRKNGKVKLHQHTTTALK